jgi:hypothetical protein
MPPAAAPSRLGPHKALSDIGALAPRAERPIWTVQSARLARPPKPRRGDEQGEGGEENGKQRAHGANLLVFGAPHAICLSCAATGAICRTRIPIWLKDCGSRPTGLTSSRRRPGRRVRAWNPPMFQWNRLTRASGLSPPWLCRLSLRVPRAGGASRARQPQSALGARSGCCERRVAIHDEGLERFQESRQTTEHEFRRQRTSNDPIRRLPSDQSLWTR